MDTPVTLEAIQLLLQSMHADMMADFAELRITIAYTGELGQINSIETCVLPENNCCNNILEVGLSVCKEKSPGPDCVVDLFDCCSRLSEIAQMDICFGLNDFHVYLKGVLRGRFVFGRLQWYIEWSGQTEMQLFDGYHFRCLTIIHRKVKCRKKKYFYISVTGLI